MSKYTVSLRQIVNGVIRQTKDVEIEAPDTDIAGRMALDQMLGRHGWNITHVEKLGGSESVNQMENPMLEYWAGYLPRVGDTVKVIIDATFINDEQTWRVAATAPATQQARICLNTPGKRDVITVVGWNQLQHAPEQQEHVNAVELAKSDHLVETLEQKEGQLRRLGDENERLRRINEKTGANLTKARKKRRDADERALALGRYTADLQDQLTARKERIEQLEEQFEERVEGLKEIIAKLESAKEVDSHAIERLQEQRTEDSIRIKELHAALRGMESHRDDAVRAMEKYQKSERDQTNAIERLRRNRDEIIAKNKELIRENSDLKQAIRNMEDQAIKDISELRGCNEMIKRLRQQIDDLVNERPTEHIGPNKDVSWEEPWRPQLGEDEELTLKTLIGQALGSASMCWTSTPTGTFWSEKAEWILGGVINEIEKLQSQPRRRYAGPEKPVEALVKEQDDDAQLWALAFANQFDMPDDDDMAITTWFANAMMTAVDKYRNAHPSSMRECNNDTFDPESEVPHPMGSEDPFQYAQRLRNWMQGFVDHIKSQAAPVFFDGEPAKDCGWSVTQNLAEKTVDWAPKTVGIDLSSGKPVTVKADGIYEFVNAPKHYNDHPSGVECQIIIRECKDPLVAFAMKHLWRSQWGGKPGQTIDQDYAKAIEYIQLEQARRAGKARL